MTKRQNLNNNVQQGKSRPTLIIEIWDVNMPPTIYLDGVHQPGMQAIDYAYVTKDERSTGTHEFSVTYIDNDNMTINTTGQKKF